MSEFSKLSINSLFGEHSDMLQTSASSGLDIKSLFLDSGINKSNFDYRMILKDISDKKDKKIKMYEAMKNACFTMIKQAQNNSLTDIIFTVPDIVTECSDYDSKSCLSYVKKKLREQFIDSFILSSTQLFITWKNIEKVIADKEKMEEIKKQIKEEISNLDNE
jgi:hypothetical protein